MSINLTFEQSFYKTWSASLNGKVLCQGCKTKTDAKKLAELVIIDLVTRDAPPVVFFRGPDEVMVTYRGGYENVVHDHWRHGRGGSGGCCVEGHKNRTLAQASHDYNASLSK